MNPAFDTTNPETWPLVLVADQVAAIYCRKVGGVRQACQAGTFVPAPFMTRPWRWRRADVLRHIEGARGVSLWKAS